MAILESGNTDEQLLFLWIYVSQYSSLNKYTQNLGGWSRLVLQYWDLIYAFLHLAFLILLSTARRSQASSVSLSQGLAPRPVSWRETQGKVSGSPSHTLAGSGLCSVFAAEVHLEKQTWSYKDSPRPLGNWKWLCKHHQTAAACVHWEGSRVLRLAARTREAFTSSAHAFLSPCCHHTHPFYPLPRLELQPGNWTSSQ